MLCSVHFLWFLDVGCGLMFGGFLFIFDIDVYAGRHQNSKTRRGGGGRKEGSAFLLSFSSLFFYRFTVLLLHIYIWLRSRFRLFLVLPFAFRLLSVCDPVRVVRVDVFIVISCAFSVRF